MKQLIIIMALAIPIGLVAQEDILFIQSGADFNSSTMITVMDGDFVNESGQAIGGDLEMHATTGNTFSLSSTLAREAFGRVEITGEGEIELNSDFEIGQQLLLGTNGILNLGSFSLVFTGTADIAGETNTNTITGSMGSYLQVQRDHTNGAVIEPFGNIGVTIEASAVPLGITDIYRRYGVLDIDGKPSILRYYDIQPTTNTGLDAITRFFYADSDLDADDPLDAVLFRSEDGVTNWENRGGLYSATNPHSLLLSGINSFSTWAIVADATALPVELVFFNAEAIDNTYIMCSWETASEDNNSHFDVERSSDGQQFEYVGEVAGAGTTDITQNYSFDDNQPYAGTSFYRLKQVDFDGAFEYSPIRQVYIDRASGMVLFPNPAREVIHISLPEKVVFSNYEIYDAQGKKVKVGDLEGITGQIDLDISILASGPYIIQLMDKKGESKVIKFIKQ